jgi:hypothetical protein
MPFSSLIPSFSAVLGVQVEGKVSWLEKPMKKGNSRDQGS